MARAEDTDPLQDFNFYLLDIPTASIAPVAFPFKVGQGAAEGNLLSFKSISIPDMSIQMKDVQEGNWPFTHHIPTGKVNTGDCTITSAITTYSMDFYFWFFQSVWGTAAPRRHLTVVQTGRDKLIPRRIVNLWGCIPKSWKPSSDFDATSSNISIETLTMAVQQVEVLPGTPIT